VSKQCIKPKAKVFAKTLEVLVLCTSFFFVACGPTVTQSARLDSFRPESFLVLPNVYASDIKREKVDYIRSALIQELQGSGFVVLDDAVVNRICSDETCPERNALAKRFSVNAFLELNVSSIQRANILAAYYNAIKGRLRLLDNSSQELLSIEQSQSEKGGLLFNSGQVLQGLISSVENSRDESFNNLADKFVRTLVSKLPSVRRDRGISEAMGVSISSINIQPKGESRYELCAEGTPQVNAFFLFGQNKASLREEGKGRYCGVFLIGMEPKEGTKFAVELRSPFGIVAQRAIDTAYLPRSCDPSGLVKKESRGSTSILRVQCENVADPELKKLCEEKAKRCASAQFIVYRGAGEAGPFEKVGILPASSWTWTDTHLKSNMQPHYTIIAVSQEGFRSLPAPVMETW